MIIGVIVGGTSNSAVIPNRMIENRSHAAYTKLPVDLLMIIIIIKTSYDKASQICITPTIL